MNSKGLIIIFFLLFLFIVFFSSLQTVQKNRLKPITTTAVKAQTGVTAAPTIIPTTYPTPTTFIQQHHSINGFYGENGDD